ncbi:MAG: hypothetical protein ABH833_02490 [Parcubacteria group bacterium]
MRYAGLFLLVVAIMATLTINSEPAFAGDLFDRILSEGLAGTDRDHVVTTARQTIREDSDIRDPGTTGSIYEGVDITNKVLGNPYGGGGTKGTLTRLGGAGLFYFLDSTGRIRHPSHTRQSADVVKQIEAKPDTVTRPTPDPSMEWSLNNVTTDKTMVVYYQNEMLFVLNGGESNFHAIPLSWNSTRFRAEILEQDPSTGALVRSAATRTATGSYGFNFSD